jgi:hypothetical protein
VAILSWILRDFADGFIYSWELCGANSFCIRGRAVKAID